MSEPVLTCPKLEKTFPGQRPHRLICEPHQLIGTPSAYLCAPSAYLGAPSAYLGIPSAYLGETKIKLTKMEFGLSLTKINNLDKYMISTAQHIVMNGKIG